MTAPRQFQSLTAVNQYVFTCPIFNVDTKVSACVKLDYKVMRGEDVPVRKGCQVCMRANLCPIRHLQKLMFRTGKELCFSAEAKKGKLPDEILDRIRPIVVVESHFSGIPVSATERDLIEKASGLSGSIPKGSGVSLEALSSTPADAAPKKRKAAKKAAPESQSDASLDAAKRGDMSAAINAAMENAA